VESLKYNKKEKSIFLKNIDRTIIPLPDGGAVFIYLFKKFNKPVYTIKVDVISAKRKNNKFLENVTGDGSLKGLIIIFRHIRDNLIPQLEKTMQKNLLQSQRIKGGFQLIDT
jgi:hypothetical protein